MARWAAYLVLAAATFAVFAQAIGFEFVVLDDPVNITNNPYFRPLTLKSVGELLIVAYAGLFIPVTYALWAVLAAVSQFTAPEGEAFDPRLFHAANLLLHIGCGALVYRIALRLVGSPVAACLGALVFLLHPMQVETVCWVTAAKDLLSSLFSLAALAIVLDEAAKAGPGDPAVTRSNRYLIATLLFCMALMSKPSAVTVPAILVAILWLGYRWPLRQALMRHWDWFFIAVVWIVVTRVAQPTGDMPFVPPLWQRPLVAADALTFYLGKMFWPWPLAIDYGRTPSVALASGWIYFVWLVPLGVAVLMWLTGNAVARAGAAVALLAPAPVLGLLPFQFQRFSTVADRYTYFAFVGVALVVAALVARFPRIVAPAVGIAVAALAVVSWNQADFWRDSGALLTHANEVNPKSAAVLVNLGVYHQERREYDLANTCFEKAVALDPDGFESNIGWGTSKLRDGDYAAALACFEKALAKFPLADRPNAGAAWSLHRLGDTARAAPHYRRAAEPAKGQFRTLTAPEMLTVWNGLARILATDKNDAVRNGTEAVTWASRAVEQTGSQNSPVLDTLAAALAEAGDFEGAVEVATRARDLAKSTGHLNLAEKFEAHRRLFEARQPLRESAEEQWAM